MEEGMAVTIEGNVKEEETECAARYLTCNQWVAKHSWPSIAGLRWMIFKSKNDPLLRSTFIRVGRRVLLNEKKFLDYLEQMNEEHLREENGSRKS
jgi:hypothetical protein